MSFDPSFGDMDNFEYFTQFSWHQDKEIQCQAQDISTLAWCLC